jgi:hypothetical protein
VRGGKSYSLKKSGSHSRSFFLVPLRVATAFE